MAEDNLLKLLNLSHTGHLTPGGEIPQNELLRKFNLGSKRIARLSPARDVFFTIVSKFQTNSTDDPEFKHIEEREVWHRRYAYIMAAGNTTTATSTYWAKSAYDTMIGNKTMSGIKMTCDYNAKGQFSNKYLRSGNDLFDKDETRPTHMFKGQVLKIPVTHAAANDGEVKGTGTINLEITSIENGTGSDSGRVIVGGKILSHPSFTLGSGNVVAIGTGWKGGNLNATEGSTLTPMRDLTKAPTVQNKRREDRVYVVGSTYSEASGLPHTSYTDRLADDFGFTQIFKNDLTMSNTAIATMLKHRPQEYQRRWRKVMLAHKRDINMAGLFSVKNKADVDGKMKRQTEGLINFIMNNGWIFDITANKTYDDFLEDMSEFFHPEVAQENGHMFHVDTATFNWFNRLNGGFIDNSINGKNYFSADMKLLGTKQFSGFYFTEISLPHGGVMRMVKDINLDGTGIKILGVNYNQVEYRPLVGNNVNRDTTVYMKVKSIENGGDDYRTDLVQTEAGFDFSLGETFAMWK